MIMTEEQRQDFNSLSARKKKNFLKIASEHPQWDFSKVMTKLAFDEKTDSFIDNGGRDVDPNDTGLWRDILRGVKVTLSKFQSISSRIITVLDTAIKTLTKAIEAGIKKAGMIIRGIKESLFY